MNSSLVGPSPLPLTLSLFLTLKNQFLKDCFLYLWSLEKKFRTESGLTATGMAPEQSSDSMKGGLFGLQTEGQSSLTHCFHCIPLLKRGGEFLFFGCLGVTTIPGEYCLFQRNSVGLQHSFYEQTIYLFANTGWSPAKRLLLFATSHWNHSSLLQTACAMFKVPFGFLQMAVYWLFVGCWGAIVSCFPYSDCNGVVVVGGLKKRVFRFCTQQVNNVGALFSVDYRGDFLITPEFT